MSRWLERLAVVAASLAVAIGVIAVLSGGLLAGHDAPGVSGSDGGPGTAFRDQGDSRLPPGELRPVYDSNPPTSGPHLPEAITRNRVHLSDDQVLQALAAGDVIFMYGTRTPPPGLTAVAGTVAPPFSAALAASGQAVVLASRPGLPGVTALAWTHMLRVTSPRDPALQTFAQFWLGRGAPRAGKGLPRS
ncbi:MAG TPA: DUF3105 domain-containing protein [Solirubrobacteraceae bacterium]|jgi:hypothetical protein|nr:DUF3105 domain-containing protein [Solirubrobacteraceae bacterium]